VYFAERIAGTFPSAVQADRAIHSFDHFEYGNLAGGTLKFGPSLAASANTNQTEANRTMIRAG